jgi:hypothetical protein
VAEYRYHDAEESEAMFKMARVDLEYVHEEILQYSRQ